MIALFGPISLKNKGYLMVLDKNFALEGEGLSRQNNSPCLRIVLNPKIYFFIELVFKVLRLQFLR
jgi:hypothetical protein